MLTNLQRAFQNSVGNLKTSALQAVCKRQAHVLLRDMLGRLRHNMMLLHLTRMRKHRGHSGFLEFTKKDLR